MALSLPERLPGFVGRLPAPPPGLLRPVFQQLIAGMLRRHPEMFERLGEYGRRRFLIDPVDLPVIFIMRPDAERPLLTPHRRGEAVVWEAAVRGPLPKLISMVNGEEDGDALFFSRDIVIEGDTEAVLALRNAIDDAGIDLVEETEALLGPFAGVLAALRKRAVPLLEAAARIAGAARAAAGRAHDKAGAHDGAGEDGGRGAEGAS